jgi:DNA invertase Pin-like site-specific DNA recombinase
MKAKAKTVAAYVRVSTVGQNEAGQRAEIDRWLTGNGIDPRSIRWFTDKATGDSLRRPAFDRLQAAVSRARSEPSSPAGPFLEANILI